jgi:hypothetical protein
MGNTRASLSKHILVWWGMEHTGDALNAVSAQVRDRLLIYYLVEAQPLSCMKYACRPQKCGGA